MTTPNLLKYNNLTGAKRRDKQLRLIGMCSYRTNTRLSPNDEGSRDSTEPHCWGTQNPYNPE